jgi:hypothetical protein
MGAASNVFAALQQKAAAKRGGVTVRRLKPQRLERPWGSSLF